MKSKDMIGEADDFSTVGNWFARRGLYGVRRAATAKDEQLEQFRLEKMVNDMEMAFNDAVSSGLISSRKTSATGTPQGEQPQQTGQSQQPSQGAPANVEGIKSSLSSLTPEERSALKKSIEDRIAQLKSGGGQALDLEQLRKRREQQATADQGERELAKQQMAQTQQSNAQTAAADNEMVARVKAEKQKPGFQQDKGLLRRANQKGIRENKAAKKKKLASKVPK